LRPETIKNLTSFLSIGGAHRFEIQTCSTRDCDVFADGFREAFIKAGWSEVASPSANGTQLMFKSPPGIVISNFGDVDGAKALHDAALGVLGVNISVLKYASNGNAHVWLRIGAKPLRIGAKPLDIKISQK